MEIKTKYNLNDKIWVMRDNEPTQIIIDSIEVFISKHFPRIIYYINDFDEGYSEKQVFSTKEELLKSL